MSTQIPIGEPVETGAGRIIFVTDEVAEHPALDDAVPLGTVEKRRLWTSNEVIEELREKHAGIPIYGVWQVALTSGWVGSEPGVWVLNTTGGTRLFLYRDESGRAVESGHIVGDEIVSELDALSGHRLDEIEAHEVRADLTRVVLPRVPARTLAEIAEENERTDRQIVLHVMVLAMVVALGAVGADWLLKAHHRARLAEVSAAQRLLDEAKAERDNVLRHYILDRPSNEVRLLVLSELIRRDPGARLSASAAGSAVDLGEPGPMTVLVSERTPVSDVGLGARPRPDGLIEVEVP